MQDIYYSIMNFIDYAGTLCLAAATLGVLAGLFWLVLTIAGLIKYLSPASHGPGAVRPSRTAGVWLLAFSVVLLLSSLTMAVAEIMRGGLMIDAALEMAPPDMRQALSSKGASEVLLGLQGVLFVWTTALLPGALALALWGPVRERSRDEARAPASEAIVGEQQ